MNNESMAASKHRFKALLSVVIAVIMGLLVFTTTAFADTVNQYSVTIVDGCDKSTITTTESEPIDILNAAGISLSKDDKMDLTSFAEGEGGTIVISRLNKINIEYQDKITTYSVYSALVGGALEEAGVTLSDNEQANYSVSDPVQDGMVITIKQKFSVKIIADGNTSTFTVIDGTVKDVLEKSAVKMGDDDYTTPALDTALTPDMTIKVHRVTYKQKTKTVKVKYKTVKKDDSTLAKGKTKVVTKGKNGSKEVTYKIKYVDGKKTDDKQEVSSKVVTEAVDKVVKVGTKKVKKTQTTTKKSAKKKSSSKKSSSSSSSSTVKSNGVKSKNGYTVGQTISGRYTYYCACASCNGNSNGITSSGKRIYNGMKNPHYIACNWLPLGSVISVDGTNYTVVDRGGSGLSRKGRIDIFTPDGHAACNRYGTGSCTIKIVRLGW